MQTIGIKNTRFYTMEIPEKDLSTLNFKLTEQAFENLRQQTMQGNHALIEHIFTHHYKQALLYLKRKGCDAMEAEDVVSEVLARLPKELAARNEHGDFRIKYGNLQRLFDLMCERLWYKKHQRDARMIDSEMPEIGTEKDNLVQEMMNEQLALALLQTRQQLEPRGARLLKLIDFLYKRMVDVWDKKEKEPEETLEEFIPFNFATLNAARVFLTDTRGKFKQLFIKHFAYLLKDYNIAN